MSNIPTRITLHKESRCLGLHYADGRQFSLPCEYLRVFAPSADVSGLQPKLEVYKESVNIDRLEPVGNYALRIFFDDGHKSGIYAWEYLADLATNHETYWRDYLARLAAQGYTRRTGDPAT
jgi:DUF971 family protein